MPPSTPADDPLEAEILRHALRIAAEEASIVVVQSAHSAMIVEGADACAGILDREARLVTLSTATNLMHASSLRCSLPAVLADHDVEAMQPGDVFVMNDCFRGGIHANDLLVFRPVFVDGRVEWFTGTLIHVADLGGSSAGGIVPSATDVFAEGLQLPPVLLYAAGEPVRDLHRLLALNSRTPERVLGDVQALVAGVNVAAERMVDLAGRFGGERLKAGIDAYLTGAERRMRAELARLETGTYQGAYTLDGDGIDLERRPVVRVEVRVGRRPGREGEEGTIELDFSATDDQALGAINAGFSQALTGAVYAVRCFVDPTIPMNEGCFAPVEVVFRKGSLLDPNPPAACGGRVVAVTAVCEAVVEALGARGRTMRRRPAPSSIPTRSQRRAASIRGCSSPTSTVASARGAAPTGRVRRAPSSSAGATSCPGRGARGDAADPLRVSAAAAGLGRGRAMARGLGVETRIRVLQDAELAVRNDRVVLPPCGREGGRDGLAGEQYVIGVDGATRPLPAKAANLRLAADECFVLTTSGGGGLGPPAERDRERVLEDLAEGFVTPQAAAAVYGVELAPHATSSGGRAS
ncbi:MAG: hydantoinase B/oxoprolinase family protein [Myxococcota bacterium]